MDSLCWWLLGLDKEDCCSSIVARLTGERPDESSGDGVHQAASA